MVFFYHVPAASHRFEFGVAGDCSDACGGDGVFDDDDDGVLSDGSF